MPARRGPRAAAALVLVAAALAASTWIALGAPGDRDRGFGVDGLTTLDLGGDDGARAVALQPDGRIVLAGSSGADIAVARLLPDGSPDPGFATGGTARIDFGGFDSGEGMAVQPDGRIVVAGSTSAGTGGIAVARLNADGSPDVTFGGEGTGRRSITSPRGFVDALALQPDGGILLAGQFRPGANDDMLVMRLSPEGSTDPGFGTGGFVGIDFAPRDAAQAIAVAPDGRIVVAGHKGGGNDLAVARLTAEGALDPSFDGDGRMTSGLRGSDSARALALQPDGRIVVAGALRPDSFEREMFVARIGVDGSLDATFADDGTTSVDIVNKGTDAAEAVLLQPDGAIVIAGAGGVSSAMTVARLTPDGSLDAGFGAGGRVRLRFGSPSTAYAAALAPDGGIVLAGSAGFLGATDTALARLEGGGALVPARCAGQRAALVGTPGRDELRGTPGRDVVAALGGNDTVRGLGGNDLICLGPGKDRGIGGPGADRIFGDGAADRLFGGPGADRLQGGAGPDLLSGDDGDDRLLGGPGADLLLGGSGRDRLDGLGGRDEARGGEGSDACRAEVRILC